MGEDVESVMRLKNTACFQRHVVSQLFQDTHYQVMAVPYVIA